MKSHLTSHRRTNEIRGAFVTENSPSNLVRLKDLRVLNADTVRRVSIRLTRPLGPIYLVFCLSVVLTDKKF